MKYASAVREAVRSEKTPLLLKTDHFNYTDVPTITVSRGTPKSVASDFSKTALKPPLHFNHHESFLDSPPDAGRHGGKSSPKRSARLARIDLN